MKRSWLKNLHLVFVLTFAEPGVTVPEPESHPRGATGESWPWCSVDVWGPDDGRNVDSRATADEEHAR